MSFAITPATRKSTPALVCLWGMSGSGKTYSALRLARGLVGPAGRIGLIDTENRRAEFYATVGGGWDHIDLQPPFSPARYTEALKSFEDAGGYDCIIVDSMSHVWEGQGGVLDMAGANTSKGLQKWNAPKVAYKRMANGLMRAPFHVIFCLRAKESVRQVGDKIENLGLAPICEKNFIYEMTVSVLLGRDHKPVFDNTGQYRSTPEIPSVKAPEEIWGSIKPGEYLSEETGKTIAAWINGGAAFDHDGESLKRTARDISTLGTEALRQHWDALDKAGKKILQPHMEEMKEIAALADEEAKNPNAEDDEDTGPQDDPFADQFTSTASATTSPTPSPARTPTPTPLPVATTDHAVTLKAIQSRMVKAGDMSAVDAAVADYGGELDLMRTEAPDLYADAMEAINGKRAAFKG